MQGSIAAGVSGVGGADDYRQVITRSFVWMLAGMALAAVSAWWVQTSALIEQWKVSFSAVSIIFLLVWLVLSLGFKPIIKAVPAAVGAVLFVIYALLTGVSLGLIVQQYTQASVVLAFMATVLLFGAMVLLALFTKINFRKLNFYLFAGVIAIVLISLVNWLWFQSFALDWWLALAGIVLFSFTTGSAVQQIEAEAREAAPDKRDRVAIVGAAILFTNFVVLFTRILRATGKAK